MIAAAYPEVAFHRPRAVGRKDEWLWESATKFCAKLDRYAERTGPRKSSFGASQASLYSFPVFTHQETTIAAPVIAASMPAARERPSEAMISNQWLHIWATLASIKSVQKAKTQDASVSRCVLSIATFSAWRAFREVIALNRCSCTNFIISFTI